MSNYNYYPNPTIRFFPRAKKYLFAEERKKTEDGKEEIENKCELNDIIENYTDLKKYTLADKHFKTIEEKVYLDLSTYNSTTKTYKVSKKCCIGFLKQPGNDVMDFINQGFRFKSVEILCDFSNKQNSPMTLYIDSGCNCNKDDPKKPVIVNLSDEKNYVKEFTVNVEYRDNYVLPATQKIKVKFRFNGDNDWKSENEHELELYRNAQKSLDEFYNGSSKDKDFFVLPCYCISENQAKCIEQLEIINNQVFSRNKKLESFNFVRENGYFENLKKEYEKIQYENLKNNIKNSINSFKTYSNDKAKGCRSGNVIGNFKTKYDYSFDYYGQQNMFVEFISENYGIPVEELKGRILDRMFLFGRCENFNPIAKYEGIVNLYRNVVIPFINDFKAELNSFLGHNVRYLSCPKYNENYQRGPLTVTNRMVKYLYYERNWNIFQLKDIIEGYNGGNQLPEGTVIRFAQGKDEYAFDTTAEHYYRVRSVFIPGYHVKPLPADKRICVKLSFEDKKSCDDKINYNYSDYINPIDIKLTDLRDRVAVRNYNNHGIPYFMFGAMEKWIVNGEKSRSTKMTKQELFSWKEEANNWYSYKAKPNTQDFGIDCSGLIVNCLLSIKNRNNSLTRFYSIEKRKDDELNVNSSMMGGKDNTNSRRIEIEENRFLGSFVQDGDIVYVETPKNEKNESYKHIGVCDEGRLNSSFDNNYVLLNSLTDTRYFNVIHNYGTEYVNIENLTDRHYSNVFLLKTIKGPFRHWGFSVNSMFISRVYLWN